MSTYTTRAQLDVGRGVRLARAAYSSRRRKAPPAIIEAHFEDANGAVLQSYSAKELLEELS